MNAVRSDSVDFFLGTTTPAGFKGYFEPLRREPGMQMYLIKSGPGCGKSTLMKRLAVKAEQKGEPIQRIHCASDPDSLDGVIFLDKRAAIVDATAPHVMEPDAPGAEEQVVSLYHTLDADALHAHTDEVKRLFAQNTALRGISHLPGACCWTAAGLRRAVPTSRKSAATSSGSAPGLSPACPRGPRPAKSCGCCRPSRRKGRSSTAAPYRRWPTGMWSSMTTTAPSPACFSSSSGPRRWPGAITSSPAPAPCTPTTR